MINQAEMFLQSSEELKMNELHEINTFVERIPSILLGKLIGTLINAIGLI